MTDPALIYTWLWDGQVIETGSLELGDALELRVPGEIHEAALEGRLVPASRLAVTISPDRRRHRRRAEDRRGRG